jgi:methylated-DNA-protein-cysteine methyltransferase related protein
MNRKLQSKSKKKREAYASASDEKRAAVIRCIRSLPAGKVSTYGAIAKAASWPRAARQVARILQQVQGLPWYRVLGSGGAIKVPGEYAAEQRFRLQMEGVKFQGARVDMKKCEFLFGKSRPAPTKSARS